MKDLIAPIATRLKGRSLRDYAAPPAPDGTPSWWEDVERAFRRPVSPDSPREEVR